MKTFKIYNLVPIMTAVVIFASGCSTTGGSVGLGAGVGAGTGMAIGAIADPGQNGQYRTRNVIIGGAAGALTGMLAGSLIHSSAESSKSEAFKAGRASAPSPVDPSLEPKLILAQWRAEVVEAKRVGNRFIPRHVEYLITGRANFSVSGGLVSVKARQVSLQACWSYRA